MIGNDIIDLEVSALENNWRRKGYLEKIYTREEQEIINTSPKPDETVWLFWSMKESAYKAHQRNFNLERKFNPKEFQCLLNAEVGSPVSGKVIIQGISYFTRSSVTTDYIYSYACTEKDKTVHQKIKSNSTDIKQEFLTHFCNFHKLSQRKVSILKNSSSIPYICYENRELFCNLSFTHHGKYSAFIYELINL